MSPERLSTFFCSVCERRLALLLDVDVDAVVVEEGLDVGQLAVGVADDLGHVVLEPVIWVVTGLASRTPMPARIANAARYTRKIARPRGRHGSQEPDDRVEDQRHDRRPR